MEEFRELPKGWVTIKIGNISDQIRGVSYTKEVAVKEPQKGYVPILKANNINKELNFDDLVYVPKSNVKEEQLIKSLDIIVAMSSGSKNLVGKAAQARFDFNGGFGAFCGLIRVNPILNKKFIGFFFQSDKYKKNISKLSSGININNLRREHIESIEVSIPPLPEQHRIVARIEELFATLDAGIESIQKVKAQLKCYRQAVLKNAFEGKLTENWRKANKDSLEPASILLKTFNKREIKNSKIKKEPLSVSTLSLSKLPGGWLWARIDDIGDVSGGLTKNSKRKKNSLIMPYLRVANVYSNRLDLNEIKEIGLTIEEFQRYSLNKDDLLIVEGNGSIEQIGRVAVWDGSINPCVHQNHIIKVRFSNIQLSKYILYWLLSLNGRKQITNVASSTSGLYTLSISKVSALFIPLAPIAEQKEIVEEIERHFSIVDQIDRIVEQTLLRSERMRQSILRKAFEGKLVPQNPNDEPAEELIERIKTEKANQKNSQFKEYKHV